MKYSSRSPSLSLSLLSPPSRSLSLSLLSPPSRSLSLSLFLVHIRSSTWAMLTFMLYIYICPLRFRLSQQHWVPCSASQCSVTSILTLETDFLCELRAFFPTVLLPVPSTVLDWSAMEREGLVSIGPTSGGYRLGLRGEDK